MEDGYSSVFNHQGDQVWITKGYDGNGPEVTSIEAPSGRSYPIADWDNLSDAARNALDSYPFGGRPCPLSKAMFDGILEASKPKHW